MLIYLKLLIDFNTMYIYVNKLKNIFKHNQSFKQNNKFYKLINSCNFIFMIHLKSITCSCNLCNLKLQYYIYIPIST